MTDFICECVPMMIFMSLVNNQPSNLKGWGEVVTCNIEELHEIQAQERATASQIVVAILEPGLWWPGDEKCHGGLCAILGNGTS